MAAWPAEESGRTALSPYSVGKYSAWSSLANIENRKFRERPGYVTGGTVATHEVAGKTVSTVRYSLLT